MPVEAGKDPACRDSAEVDETQITATQKDSVPRPVATPARSVLPQRMVSSDAQPSEQQIWENSFGEERGPAPEAPSGTDSDDEMMFEVDCEACLHLCLKCINPMVYNSHYTSNLLKIISG